MDSKFREHSQPCCVSVGPVSNVRSLGVTIDDMPSFSEHVNNVCKSWNYHITSVSTFRRTLQRPSPVQWSTNDSTTSLCCSRYKTLSPLSLLDDGSLTISHQFLQIYTDCQSSFVSSISFINHNFQGVDYICGASFLPIKQSGTIWHNTFLFCWSFNVISKLNCITVLFS